MHSRDQDNVSISYQLLPLVNLLAQNQLAIHLCLFTKLLQNSTQWNQSWCYWRLSPPQWLSYSQWSSCLQTDWWRWCQIHPCWIFWRIYFSYYVEEVICYLWRFQLPHSSFAPLSFILSLLVFYSYVLLLLLLLLLE